MPGLGWRPVVLGAVVSILSNYSTAVAEEMVRDHFTVAFVESAVELAGFSSERVESRGGGFKLKVNYSSEVSAHLTGYQCDQSGIRCEFLLMSAPMPYDDAAVSAARARRTVDIFNRVVLTAAASSSDEGEITVRRLLSSGGAVSNTHVAYEIDMFAESLVPMRNRLDQIQRDCDQDQFCRERRSGR